MTDQARYTCATMLILGIETSCDETSVAVVEDGRILRSNMIFSQIEMHRKTGGVVPEVAAREHIIKIVPVIEESLKKAQCTLADLDAIAVTYGPGLMTSLLTGVNTAMTLAKVLQIPLIPVNHIEGHMYANWIVGEVDRESYNAHREIQNNKDDTRYTVHSSPTPQFPLVVLTASGGHNELILWKDHGRYTFLGATLDDAAGEAFDKVARLLGLPYPGGPQISKAAENGDSSKYPLPRAWLTKWDFSFSGLKTAVLRLVEKYQNLLGDQQFINDVSASFQEAVVDVLATKLAKAAKKYGAKEAHLAGGVSANRRLRARARELLSADIPLKFCSDITLCTDNAAMIAAAGFYRYQANPEKYKTWKSVEANPNLAVKNW